MFKKKIVKIFSIFFFLLIFFFAAFFKFYKNNKIVETKEKEIDIIYKSNIIEDVEYNTKDLDGNEYIIRAKQGEIEFSNSNIIFLTKVNAIIKLIDSEQITIVSDYGKYNSENFDTIFSKNIIINYLDNKINGEYLDFSLKRNSMIISKNVIYSNLENILTADVIEMNIKTKDTKIYMYENEKKVNIKSKN